MKRRNLQIALVVGVLALTVANPAMAQLFSARLDSSRWQSVAGDGACHLTHDVSRFGLALVTESLDAGLSTTVLSRRGPPATRRGQASGVSPAWKPEAKRALFMVTARPGPTMLSLNAAQTTQTLVALEAGDIVRFRFHIWRADSAAIDLSPVGFRTALRDHIACMARLARSTSPKDGSDRPRASAASIERMAPPASAAQDDGAVVRTVASAEIEQLPPPPQFTFHFANDSARLDKPDYDILEAAARAFSEQSFWSRIVITGHADRSGASAYNRHLALLRAIEIRNRLVRLGIDDAKLEVRTAGENEPVADTADEQARGANRRVEIQALL